jgi:hypothetical protein
VLAVRDEVLLRDAGLVLDDDRPLAAALLAELDLAVDLADDGRVLRLAGLEDLGDSRQTAGDVLRSGHLSRRLGDQGAGLDLLRRPRPRCGPSRASGTGRGVPFGVLDHDLRVQVALVLDDDHAGRRASTSVLTVFALDDVLEADPASLGQDGDVVRVPLAELACFDLDGLVVLHVDDGAGGDRWRSISRPFLSMMRISPLRLITTLAFLVLHHPQVVELG